MKRILLLAVVALWPLAARAQLSPNWSNGYKPQASEWNALWGNALDMRTLGQPGSAALLDAAGTLSANQVLATGTSTPLTLANDAVQRLDPRRFGALCNGSTDDQAAFNSITGYINRASSSVVRTNTAWEIDTAGGRCVLSQPWTIAYGAPNISVHIHGDGSAHSELEWTGGVNGIVVSFAANANGNEAARGTTYAGQGIEVDGLHLIAATGGGRAGTALTVNGIPLTNASNPPFQRYSDLVIGNDNGYADAATNWAGGLYLVNPDNVVADGLMWWDHALQSNTTSIPYWLHSTAPAGGPGHGNISFDHTVAVGGATGFQIDGNAFQGINLSHLFTVYVQTGVSWVAGANTLSGSLTIDHSSLGAQQTIVTLANVSTVTSDDNLYYNTSPPAGHNFYAFSSLGGDTIEEHNDTFIGPAPGAMGAGYTSTAVVVFSPGTFDPQGSVVSGDSVSGFDVGYVGSGGPISFKDDRAASTTATCYQDAGAQTSSALHPDFDGMSCGQTLDKDDGKGLALAFDWAPQRFLNGSLELGLPGTTSPGGVTGYGGQIDFHSVAAATASALNDYDCRLAGYGGVSGTPGLGGLTGTCALGLIMSGQLVDQSAPRVAIAAGATVQAADNTTGIELAPGATIASGTLALPANPVNDQTFFAGTEQTITAFSLTAPASTGGVAHYVNSPPSTLTAACPVGYRFEAAVATWDPIVGACGGGSGTPGQAATIAAGTATALAAGSNPTVSNSGTSSNATFNFGIPAGQSGAPGNSTTTGSAVPSAASGINGDTFILSTSGEIYNKTGGAWVDSGTALPSGSFSGGTVANATTFNAATTLDAQVNLAGNQVGLNFWNGGTGQHSMTGGSSSTTDAIFLSPNTYGITYDGDLIHVDYNDNWIDQGPAGAGLSVFGNIGTGAYGNRTYVMGSFAVASMVEGGAYTGVASQSHTYSSVNVPAAYGWPDVWSDTGGEIENGWDFGQISANVKGWYADYGHEVDVALDPTVQVADLVGITAVDQSGAINNGLNGSGGIYRATAFAVGGGVGGGDWTCGFCVAGELGPWSLNPTGTILGAQQRQYGGPATSNGGIMPTARWDMDYRVVANTSNGGEIALPGFGVNANGGVGTSGLNTPSVQALSVTLGSLSIDFPGNYLSFPALYVQASPTGSQAGASVAAMKVVAADGFGSTGSGYQVGDVLSLPSTVTGTAPTFTVATIDANGGVLTWTISAGAFTSSRVEGIIALTGGHGTGAMVLPTYGTIAYGQTNAGAYTVNALVNAATGSGWKAGDTATIVGDTGTAGVYTLTKVSAQGGIMMPLTVSTPGALTALASATYHTLTPSGSGVGGSILVGYGIAATSTTPGAGYVPGSPPLITSTQTNYQHANLTAIMGTAPTTLALNPSGGAVTVGSGGLTSPNGLAPTVIISAGHVLSSADCGVQYGYTGSAAATFPIPSGGLPIGCAVGVVQAGAGTAQVTAPAGVGFVYSGANPTTTSGAGTVWFIKELNSSAVYANGIQVMQ